MSLYRQFATNPTLEAEGVEFTFNDSNAQPVFRVRLARAGGANKKYDTVREREMAPLRRIENPSSALLQKVARRVFAEACALPGTWQFKERIGHVCQGNTLGSDLVWSPAIPGCRTSDGFLKGIETKTGEVVTDTVENVVKVLEDLPELFMALAREANSIAAFKDEDLQDDSKN
jgi:hypothetical protein